MPITRSPSRTRSGPSMSARSTTPHRKAGQIEVAGLIKAGQLGGLAPEQRAVDGRARGGDRADQHPGLAGVELADGEVVQEADRPGAGADQIVDAHRNEVLTQTLEQPRLPGEQQLGPDPVGTRQQHRLAHRRQRDPAGESGHPAGDEPRDVGGVRTGRIEIDAGVAVRDLVAAHA